MVNTSTIPPIDCACVIYGDKYDWSYVEKLYNMLSRNISPGIRLHVYTEESRIVPEPFIKHSLTDWNLTYPKSFWWYKMQLFNPEHHAGTLMYFDLDVVVTGNLDWIWKLDTNYFWAIRDFKSLQEPTFYGINSSVMWWDTTKFVNVWKNFNLNELNNNILKYKGDQDYISEKIDKTQRKFFDSNYIQSWRWQAVDGGFNFKTRKFYKPGKGTTIGENTAILVFHGNPKPGDIKDLVILEHWR